MENENTQPYHYMWWVPEIPMTESQEEILRMIEEELDR